MTTAIQIKKLEYIRLYANTAGFSPAARSSLENTNRVIENDLVAKINELVDAINALRREVKTLP